MVSQRSFIDFQGVALSAPPRVFVAISDLGFKRANPFLYDVSDSHLNVRGELFGVDHPQEVDERAS